jgi:queuosine precursor transporter
MQDRPRPDNAIDAKTGYFLFLLTLHSSLLITSTVAGSKLFALPFGFDASATVFSYLLTFVVLDTIAELFGKDYSRRVINLGLIGMAVSAAYFEFASKLPPAPGWHHQEGFEAVVSSSIRIWVGGWTAYFISQHFELWLFLWLRKTAFGRDSVVFCAWLGLTVAQLLDTAIFVSIAFYGTGLVESTIIGQYLIKLLFSTIAAPLVKFSVAMGRRWTEGQG